VVLVGSVGGVPNPSDQSTPDFPFAKGQAIFFLVDPEFAAEAEEHAHTHAEGEECAFCAAHAADSAHAIAVVQFADEKGKPLAVDARDLFDLKEKETVVVKGKAKAAANGMITVDATGLYVRR
jgi:L-lactate utilization protein LutC